jgi:hypothetical protein
MSWAVIVTVSSDWYFISNLRPFHDIATALAIFIICAFEIPKHRQLIKYSHLATASTPAVKLVWVGCA